MKRLLPTLLTWALLGVCIWRVQVVGHEIARASPQFAGETVTASGEGWSSVTERLVGEAEEVFVGRIRAGKRIAKEEAGK